MYSCMASYAQLRTHCSTKHAWTRHFFETTLLFKQVSKIVHIPNNSTKMALKFRLNTDHQNICFQDTFIDFGQVQRALYATKDGERFNCFSFSSVSKNYFVLPFRFINSVKVRGIFQWNDIYGRLHELLNLVCFNNDDASKRLSIFFQEASEYIGDQEQVLSLGACTVNENSDLMSCIDNLFGPIRAHAIRHEFVMQDILTLAKIRRHNLSVDYEYFYSRMMYNTETKKLNLQPRRKRGRIE